MSAVLAEQEEPGIVVRRAQPQALSELMRYSRSAFEQSN